MRSYIELGGNPHVIVANINNKQKRLSECTFPENKNLNLYNQVMFLYAVKTNDIESVGYFINQGVDINYRDNPNNFTPLHWAIHKHNFGIAQILIQNNANLNAIADNLQSNIYLSQYGHKELRPLTLAIVRRNVSIIQLILDNYAKSSIKFDYQLKKEIGYIVYRNDLSMMQMLLSSKEFAEVLKEESFYIDRKRGLGTLVDFSRSRNKIEMTNLIQSSFSK